MTVKTGKNYKEHWYDDSYRDRQHELVSASEIARMAGVTGSAVSAWRSRHPDFPLPVKEVTAGASPTGYFVAEGVVYWIVSRNDEHKARLSALAAELNSEADDLRQRLLRLESLRDQITSAIDRSNTDH